MSGNVLRMLTSRSFLVSGLIFRSLNHVEFIFVYSMRECSNFIDLHVAGQLLEHHLLKTPFLHYILLPPCPELGDDRRVGFSRGFISYAIDLYFYFCAIQF